MTTQPEAPGDEPPGPVQAAPLGGPPLLVRRGAFIGVLLLVAVSVVVTIWVDFRLGGYVLASAPLAGGVARWFLPEQLCLGLLVRSRRQDVITLLGLGLALAVSAAYLPG